MKNKLLMTALTFATVSAALVGCNGLNDNVATSNNNQTVKNTVTDNTNNNGTTTDSNNLITEDEAKKIALEHSGIQESDITNFRIKLDTDDGMKEYEIEFYSGNTEYDYDISAISGEVISFDNDIENDFNNNSNNTADNSNELITEDEAMAIALKDAGINEADATSLRIKLDTDDGVKEYEIEFYTADKEYDYEINASTGKIVNKDVESLKYN